MNLELFEELQKLNEWKKTNESLKNAIMKGNEHNIDLAIEIETEIYKALSKFKIKEV